MASRSSRPHLFSSALLAGLLVARVAVAEPTALDRTRAHELMDHGDELAEKHDYRGALLAYEAADAIMHVPTTGIEVARSQAALGLLHEARESALSVARSQQSPDEPAPFAEARKAAREIALAMEMRMSFEGGERPAVDAELAAGDAHGAPKKLPTLAYAGFGAGVGGLLVGTITGIASIADTVSVKSQCNADRCPPSSQGKLDAARSLGIASDVFFGIGIAGGGLGVVTLLTSKPASRSALAARLVVGPAAACVRGEF